MPECKGINKKNMFDNIDLFESQHEKQSPHDRVIAYRVNSQEASISELTEDNFFEPPPAQLDQMREKKASDQILDKYGDA